MSELKSVAVAAGKGLAFWICIHLLLTHILIALKWDATNQTIEQQNESIVAEHDMYSLYQEEKIQQIKQQIQNAIDESKKQLDELEHERTTMKASLQELSKVQDQFTQLYEINTKNQKKAPEMLKLKQLLQIETLSDLRSASQFTKYVTAATKEIENQLLQGKHSAELVDWKAYTALFSTMPSKKQRVTGEGNNDQTVSSESEASTCTVDFDTTSSSTAVYATLTDIQNAIESIHKHLESLFLNIEDNNSSGGLVLLLSKAGREALENTIASFVTDALTKINDNKVQGYFDNTLHIDDTRNVEECLTHQDVIPWLEAGLDALYTNRDVRTALFQTMAEHGVDTSRLISPISMSEDDEYKYANTPWLHYNRLAALVSAPTNPSSLNVRQLLDVPAIHFFASYLDAIFDVVSGYHDGIDDFIDKYILSKIPKHLINEPDMISKAFLQFLFNVTGPINIPIPDKIRNSNIIINMNNKNKAGLLSLW